MSLQLVKNNLSMNAKEIPRYSTTEIETSRKYEPKGIETS